MEQQRGKEFTPAYFRLIFQDILPGLQPTAEYLAWMRRSWFILR
jgi:hypothetical protein